MAYPNLYAPLPAPTCKLKKKPKPNVVRRLRANPHRATDLQNSVKHDTTTREGQQASPFLRLPPELRNQIYDLLLDEHMILAQEDNPLVGKPIDEMGKSRSLPLPRNVFAITKTCRQIHAETKLLPYKKTLFAFMGDYKQSFEWLSYRSKAQLGVITGICLGGCDPLLHTLLERMPALERILLSGTVVVKKDWHLSRKANLRTYGHVHVDKYEWIYVSDPDILHCCHGSRWIF